ncbi:MAG: hypothetical protein F7B17_05680 [Desulfurococcales archaeon]|nr:hypothetical protein [Desulfurococcales archaeon]
MAESPNIEVKVRKFLVEALEDLVRDIIEIDFRLSADGKLDEVEKAVLKAYRSVLVEEIVSILAYLDGDASKAPQAIGEGVKAPA